MTTRPFRRPPRMAPPLEPRGELVLESPPDLPETTSAGGLSQALMMLPMLAGAAATALMVTGSGGRPIAYVASGMFAVSMLAMLLGNLGRGSAEKRRKADGDRRDYQRYLAQSRRQVRRAAGLQRDAALWRHPRPDALWCVALSSRLWERRAADPDFAVVRVASGDQRLAVTLVTPQTKPLEDLEPVTAMALRQFVAAQSTVADVPLALALRRIGSVAYSGDPAAIRANARALIAQALTWHAPEDLTLVLCIGARQLPDWEWAKWAPHAHSGTESDALGPARYIVPSTAAAEQMLGESLTGRARFGAAGSSGAPNHILIVLDGAQTAPESQLTGGLIDGVTVLDLQGALPQRSGAGTLSLHIGPAAAGAPLTSMSIDRLGEQTATSLGAADGLSVPEALLLARTLSPMTIGSGPATATDALGSELDLPDLLRIGDPTTLEPARTWTRRAPRDQLRVPIGVAADGQRVELDIKESAQGGMGPHGLVIGATGSGKSELLRTLVLGLAVTHAPDTLNFVLVDFKGGATFASLDALPHTSAVITNLSDNLLLVDRMRAALAGELNRRQEALRDAGNHASLRDYERARAQGAPLEPMPSLFVVVDEFSELLSVRPDFLELFVQIGRLGRSLGVHLLLASQRLEDGRLRGLETYLSYRVGLRTFSAAESRTVLGTPDAYELPSAPGHGYLKVDTADLLRFRAAYVSGPMAGPGARPSLSAAPRPDARVLPFTAGRRDLPAASAASQPAVAGVSGAALVEATAGSSMLDVLVGRLAGHGSPARQVWLPPLDIAPSLDALLGPLETTERGLRPASIAPLPPLVVPVGVVDRPFEQRRDPLLLDLASSHLAIVGGPQSGKSTTLRTVMAALALTHTPAQAQFYALDFGGGTLGAFAGLPHIGTIANRLEPDRIRRTIAEATTMLDDRERLFAEHRIDSIGTYRRMLESGRAPLDAFGDVFLIVDGWGTLRAEHEDLEQRIIQLAARGLGFGLHLIICATRWMEVRPALRELIGTRLELRLGDPGESAVDRRAAMDVPERRPGRGLTADKLHLLTALPRIDGSDDPATLVDGVADLVARVAAAWGGPAAPPVRLLPTHLPFAALPAPPQDRSAVPIGIEETTLGPVWLDLDAEQHFLVFGDVESGKSTLLRTIAAGITTRWTPAEAKIIAFDFGRGLLGAVPRDHLIAHVLNATTAPEIVANIVSALRERASSVAVDPATGHVATWTGPRLFVMIDDYQLIATSSGNPLAPLIDFVPQARDIGLHVIVARSSAGAGRALFDPLLQRLRDMGAPGVLLSGSRDEGALLGSVRMEPFPPGRGRYVHRRIGDLLVQTPQRDG